MKGKLILVLGGSRSGKSEFAENIAANLGGQVIYIATASVRDKEMADRVSLHRKRRPQSWKTIEEEKQIPRVISEGRKGDVYLLDCVTGWITNLLLDDLTPGTGAKYVDKDPYIMGQVEQLIETVDHGAHLVAVSNEVGLGLVPEYPLGRIFRDLAGKANQILAQRADRVYFVVAGLPLQIKSMVETKTE